MTTLAEATLRRLMRVAGFRREPVLNEDGVELVLYSRDTSRWFDRIVVYNDQAARAYRIPATAGTDVDAGLIGPDVADSPDVVLQVALTDVVSVVEGVLSWPVADEPERGGDS